MALAMLVLGLGIGSSMQVLTIVVQSTSAYEDLGVATSGVTFFRTLGSSFGAAVFGTVYANVLSDRLPAAVAASPGVDPAAVATPEALHAYPADQIAPIVEAYAHAMHVVFLAAVPVPLVAFVLALFLKEVPLRGTARGTAGDVGEGLRHARGRATRSSSCSWPWRACSSARGAPICPWCASVPARRWGRRTAGRWDRSTCAPVSTGPPPSRRSAGATNCRPPFSSPPSRTRPDAATWSAADGGLRLTQRGQDEIGKVITAMRAWLAEELSDWDVDDAQLNAALGDLATRFVEESPELTPQPAASRSPVADGQRGHRVEPCHCPGTRRCSSGSSG